MEEVLFQKSFHAVWQNGLRLATEDVQKLDRKLFNDPTLGGALQRIVQKYDIDVARFEGEMTAKRRTEEREGRDRWGDHRKIKTTWLDVSIPFVGEAETLRIGPSSMALLNHSAASMSARCFKKSFIRDCSRSDHALAPADSKPPTNGIAPLAAFRANRAAPLPLPPFFGDF
jgi:hypothetical protein